MQTLTMHNVYKSYEQSGIHNQVLTGVTYTFKTGSSYAITGISGTGKSTLLHILAGIDQPTTGEVFYNNHNIYNMSTKERTAFLQNAVGLVFQDAHLIKELSVLENVMLKDLVKNTSTAASIAHAKELLDLVGIADKANHHPLSLSGGQQQRVAVLRALFGKPHFLLADEPTGNLDANNAHAVVQLLTHKTDWDMGLIICSHDVTIARCMHTQLVLERGTLVEYT